MKRGFGRLAAMVALLGLMVGASCRRGGDPPFPSSPGRTFIQDAWPAYKRLYLSEPGNVLDRTRNGGETTSEGQAYLLLRAAWSGDEQAFSRAFTWTETHLRRNDGLYSWRWGPQSGGRVLDENTASDADQDIAFALILGSHAFDRPDYLQRARELLRAIRTIERLDLPGGWFPAAGNWAVDERVANLSYFLPYAYPYFARLDPEGEWLAAVNTGYDLLARTRQLTGVRLFPDFQRIDADGSIKLLPSGGQLSGDFSFDAMRIFWRVAMDCQLHKRMRACADPADAHGLAALLARDGAVFTRYRIDGTVLDRNESLSFYGGILPSLAQLAPQTAAAIKADRLSPAALDELLLLSNRYYDANWVWFGLAAADGILAERTPSPEAILR
jgi:endo-1,4-beta-D-glucanase Y